MVRTRVWLCAAALVIGIALIAVSAFGLHRNNGLPGNFGAAPSPTPTTPAAGTTRSTDAVRPQAAASSPHRTGAATGYGTIAAGAAPDQIVPAAPVALALPTLGVHAVVHQVQTTGGVLGVPDDPATVGWWTGSVPAGSAQGSTVIDGHVDSATAGIGALFYLSHLQAGDAAVLCTAAGDEITYRVDARHVYAKHQGLPADLFATTGAPRLVLITCGGPFDTTTRSYEDNIVVLASPSS